MSPATATATAARRRDDKPWQHRRALRHLASAVTVVTVRHGERLHGTTVGTTTLVSREPLLLGLCLKPSSVMAGLVRAEGRFAVNVLSGEQAALARWFADSDRPTGAEQFAGIDWDPAPGGGAPLLRGALAHFSCQVAGRTSVGDHEVLVAHVHEAATPAAAGLPLLSFAGGLHTVTPAPRPGRSPAHTQKEDMPR